MMRSAFFLTFATLVAASTLPLVSCIGDGLGEGAGEGMEQGLPDASVEGDVLKAKSGCDGKCSASCPCNEGEGDCDADKDCAGNLVCPPDGKGIERCMSGGGGGGGGGSASCNGKCSPSCPCAEGQGDCDKNQDCAGNLVCPANGPGSEFCEKPASGGNGGGSGGGSSNSGGGSSSGSSNLQVRLGGGWKGVCCNGGELEVSGGSCKWTESGRKLTTKDLRTGNTTKLNCPENGQRPTDCNCNSSGEAMHGIKNGSSVHVKNSLSKANGAPLYPNSGHETCIDQVGGKLQSRWSNASCPDWRLTNFY